MCRRNIRNAILLLAVISVLLPGPDLSNAYARPCAGEIEVRSGEGDHSVEAPGIIVIQEVSEGMEEPEDKEEREGTGHAMPDGSQEELGESCGMFEITGYCSCEICTGDNQLTFSGTVPRPGHTAAADLDIFPLGSRIRIGETVYTVEDTGACITGHVIDIYFDTHEEAVENGRYKAEVFLVKASDV